MPRGNPAGYIPGAKIPDIRKVAGARDAIFIGERGGMSAPGGSLSGFNSAFGSGYVDKGFGPVGAGRRIPVEAGTQSAMDARLSAAVNARRAQNLSSMDPGLSTRGVTPASGSRLRGLEGRGARPMPGTRMRPMQGPMYGPGRGEMVAANRQFRGNLMSNIEASRAGRTGGFRSGNMNGRTINRAIDMNRMNRTQPMLGPGRAELAGVQNRRAAGQIYKRDINRAGRLAGIENARNARPMLGPGRDELNRILATGRTSSRTAMTSKAAGGGLPGAGAAGLRPRSTGGAASGKLGGVLDSMSRNKKLAIGAGALVLGAMVVGNRREKGTSSGRSSMYRY